MKRLSFFLLLFIFISAASGFAAPQQENEQDQDTGTKIGIIYSTLGGAYIFNDVQYQSFYFSEKKLWRDIADKNNLELVELEGGVLAAGGVSAVEEMINHNVDGIVFSFNDPAGVTSGIIRAREAGIPVVANGLKPGGEVDIPYVGFAAGAEAEELGKQTAELFARSYPEKEPRILITNNKALPQNREKEEGFLRGFRSVLGDTELTAVIEDDGTVRNVNRLVGVSLTNNPDTNVIFASNDLRAFGVISAVNRVIPGKKSEIILASMGGSKRAFREIMDPQGPWRTEAAYLLKDFVEQSWNVLNEMISGERVMSSNVEYLIPSKVFVEPSLSEVETYLRTHHRIMEFDY